VRGPEIAPTVKYWIRPDLVNRINEGSIAAYFGANVDVITENSITFTDANGQKTIDNDVVLALTGYHPDYPFLKKLGLHIQDDAVETPTFNPDSFETSRNGVFIAGTVCGGRHTSRWFIENGRHHAAVIAEVLASR
jgi:thioredoxin reductase (NADPH)